VRKDLDRDPQARFMIRSVPTDVILTRLRRKQREDREEGS